MRSRVKRCTQCGSPLASSTPHEARVEEGLCPECGAPLATPGLSEFARRLARFGLGATTEPLLRGMPELPNAK